jgi:hypothetical protein
MQGKTQEDFKQAEEYFAQQMMEANEKFQTEVAKLQVILRAILGYLKLSLAQAMRDNEMATLAQRAKRQTVSCHLRNLQRPSSCNG